SAGPAPAARRSLGPAAGPRAGACGRGEGRRPRLDRTGGLSPGRIRPAVPLAARLPHVTRLRPASGVVALRHITVARCNDHWSGYGIIKGETGARNRATERNRR